MSNVKFFYGTTTPTTSNLPDGGIHFNTRDSKIITVRQGDTLNEFLGTDENVMQWYNSPESSPSAPTSSDDILPLLASNAFSGPLEDGASAVGQAQCVGGVGVSYKGHIHAAGFLSTDNGFYGKGSGLTNLNANNITSGILSVTRGGTGRSTLNDFKKDLGLNQIVTLHKTGTVNFNSPDGIYYLADYGTWSCPGIVVGINFNNSNGGKYSKTIKISTPSTFSTSVYCQYNSTAVPPMYETFNPNRLSGTMKYDVSIYYIVL